MKNFNNNFVRVFVNLSLIFFATNVFAQRKKRNSELINFKPEVHESLKYREIGPFRGGRSAAVTGVKDKPNLYYFGATGGGVWKTIDAGKTYENISDGFFGGSIGSIAVAPSDSNVIYVGGGEVTVRGNVSSGNGIWKSIDSGKTWTFSGLPKSRHIPRIMIDPQNPDVYKRQLQFWEIFTNQQAKEEFINQLTEEKLGKGFYLLIVRLELLNFK